MTEARIYVSELGAEVLAHHDYEDGGTPTDDEGTPLLAYVDARIADGYRKALERVADEIAAGRRMAMRRETVDVVIEALAKGDEG